MKALVALRASRAERNHNSEIAEDHNKKKGSLCSRNAP
jgi:hypothetical protein